MQQHCVAIFSCFSLKDCINVLLARLVSQDDAARAIRSSISSLQDECIKLFQTAAKEGNVRIMDCLKRFGLSVQSMLACGHRAFVVATRYQHLHVLWWFREQVAFRNVLDARAGYNAPLYHAVKTKRFDVLHFLWHEYGIGLDDVCSEDSGVLRCLGEYGLVNVLQWCMERGLCEEDMRANDNALFCAAAENGQVYMLRFLRTLGFSLHDVRARHNYAWWWAAFNGHLNVLIELKDWGITKANVYEASGAKKYDTLVSVAQNGHVNILQWMQEHYPLDYHHLSKLRNNMVFCAAMRGHIHVLQWCLDMGFKKRDFYDHTLKCSFLVVSLMSHQLPTMQWFVDHIDSKNFIREHYDFFYKMISDKRDKRILDPERDLAIVSFQYTYTQVLDWLDQIM